MISTTIFPGRYIQGAGALSGLGDEALRFGRTAFMNEPMPVTPQAVLAALKAADAEGRRRRQMRQQTAVPV